jgi:energy-coupling factor transport system permease protein
MITGYVDYFMSQSAVARLDPRVKMLLILCILVLVFTWANPVYLGGLVLSIVVLSLLGGIPFSWLRRLMLIVLPFAGILVLIHGFFNSAGRTPILGPLPESVPLIGGWLALKLEGVIFGVGMGFRMYALLLAMPLLITTTPMNKLVLALVKLRVPYKITFVISTAMRFAPLLLEEVRAIIDAQRLRGLDVDKMNVLQRAKVYSTVAVPLILGALNKSMQLEIGLQAKAFSGSSDRTYLHSIEMRPLDWTVTILAAGGTIAALALRMAAGFGAFSY